VWNTIIGTVLQKEDYDLEYRILTVAGKEKWIREIGHVEHDSEGSLVDIYGVLIDITDRKRSEKTIESQLERFEALRKIDMAITGSFDLRVTMEILLDQIVIHLGADAADVLLFEPSTQTLEYVSGRGFRTTTLQHTRLRPGEGYAGIAALEHHTVRIDDLNEKLGELRRAPQIVNEGFHAYYGIPLITKGQVKGILEVFHRTIFEPTPEWVEFIETLAGQAAIAIENATLFNELQRSNVELSLAYDATLEGWSKAVEMRDQSMMGHTQRVTDLCIQLAQMMSDSDEASLVNIRRGALLHDIGEMGIPDQVFLKPGPLNDEEWQIVRQHPVSAYNLLSSIPNLRPSLDIPYCHHERWDGTGYPRGLVGEMIPLSARLFTIVDVWDTLLSDRPFRRAWSKQETLQYIRDQSGKQFDPRVVEAFITLITGNYSGRI
jgi:HD-GYP domain-containing protein (c-di-GMP phosphodiesterase class II)